MKRNAILLVIAASLFGSLPLATRVGWVLFNDRRNVIPFAMVLIAAFAILIVVGIDALRWVFKRPTRQGG